MSDSSERHHILAKHIMTFGRVLRRAGLNIGTGEIMDALRALTVIGIRNRDDVYQALYSTFVTRNEQRDIFDQAFHLFWRAPSRLPQMMQLLLPNVRGSDQKKNEPSPRVKQALQEETPTRPPRPKPQKEPQKQQLDLIFTYSPDEILRKKDFADFTPEEVIQAKEFLASLRWPIEPYASRRRTPDWKGRLLDFRRTLRRNLRHNAELMRLSWLGHNRKPRPVVILCDISGSMERYSRMLLHFMHALTSGMQRIETFVFGTRLTRITRHLQHRDIDQAVDEVTRAVQDWAGGTKIGEALKDFNYIWARRVLRHGAVVMIISDGWDRGDASLLETEMARLSRSCYRLIWLNPLLGFEGYEPLTRGMQTALPYVDDFLSVHNLESLEQLGRLLSAISHRRRPARMSVHTASEGDRR